MRVLIINSVYGVGSTGRICSDLVKKLKSEGHSVLVGYGRDCKPINIDKNELIQIGNRWNFLLHAIQTRLFDNHAFTSTLATKKFLKKVEEFNPELIWIHNIHGYYINAKVLFDWLKEHEEIKIKWTLHDCWAFTGHCAYFEMKKCERWKTECNHCPQIRSYPATIFLDKTKKNYYRKKKCFTNVPHMTIITPSEWLKKLVKKSYLSSYPVTVIHNKIDNNLFKPLNSNFRGEYNLIEKFVILGVANVWDDRKGLEDFIKLSRFLTENMVIVLIGLSKKQEKNLPGNCISISKTSNTAELVKWYNTADVFFNPTHEDNFPTVNLEAKSCGCKVITYDVGGSIETIDLENDFVVNENDIESVSKIIQELSEE